MKLWAALTKETLALSRDLHALAALFVMPVVFILIMSLALQDTLAQQSGSRFLYLIDNQDHSEASRRFAERFAADSRFSLAPASGEPLAALRERRVSFVVSIPAGFEHRLTNRDMAGDPLVRVTAEPGMALPALALARAQAELTLARLGLEQSGSAADAGDGLVSAGYLASGNAPRPPTAVQQSVPAWLVFAMFFVVIPLSTIFIAERDHGTLRRLRTMNVSPTLFFAGKIVPFFFINQAQGVAMLLVGVHVVPLFGGEALALNGSLAALTLLLAATSFAAIGYAMLVAISAATVAQATIIGGVSNILLAAIGGVMAPKFLMPETMQRLADLSPMSWALDGMLEVLLHGADTAGIAWRALALSGFAIVCLIVAVAIFHRKSWRT